MQSTCYRRIGFMMVVSMISVAVSVFGGEDVADDLWQHMRDGGLITQEQYQHVLKEGRLPGGTIVKDSPIPEKEQSDWQQLAEHQIISSEELASLLFSGSVPDMTEAENRAFKELAPVYEPDRAKRLGYDLRSKHQRVDLIRFKHRMHKKYRAKYEEAKNRANELGIPLRTDGPKSRGTKVSRGGDENSLQGSGADPQLDEEIELPEGGMELQYFDDLGHPQFYQTDNLNAGDSISTDEVWPSATNGFSLTGSSITLGIWDNGAVRTTHYEFWEGRVEVKDGTSLRAHHPTAVAGTMAAEGWHPPAKGMAYQASIHSYDWDYDLAELAEAAGEIRISNHSYGAIKGWRKVDTTWYWHGNPAVDEMEDYQFGLYDVIAQERDQFVYDSIYNLPVWSAGNDRNEGPSSQPVSHYYFDENTNAVLSTTIRRVDGYDDGFDTIGSGKTAKNILTVGAVEDVIGGYSAASNIIMSAFSGFGPADDGRIKPDIVANGSGLITPAASSDSSYYLGNGISGTSFSAPSVTGSLGVLQQLHQQLHGTNQPLWASTYKGIVIHTANEAGDHPGPDYRFGWGLMNTLAIARVFDETVDWNSKPYVKEVSLPDGKEVSFKVLADTNQPLRVTICWTDVPGSIQPAQLDPTNRVLVNDLDLRVIAPDGSTNFPWVLDPAVPTNAATKNDNVLDNVEQVVIENTTTGLYTVVIQHKGVLSNEVQDVSVLLSGYQPENKELYITDISISNSVPHLIWESVVGSLHTVMSSTNLLNTNGWSGLSAPLGIIQEQTDWADETSGSEHVRFYRIHQTK